MRRAIRFWGELKPIGRLLLGCSGLIALLSWATAGLMLLALHRCLRSEVIPEATAIIAQFVASPTPSPSPSATPTPSPTATATPTFTPTPSPTATATPTPTPSPSPTPTFTLTPTPLTSVTGVEPVGQVEGNVQAVAARGDYLYLGVGPSLVVVDISDPATPQTIGQVDLPSLGEGPLTPDVQEIILSDGYAYVGAWGLGLCVVEVSEPSAPRVAGCTDFGGIQNELALSDSYAYVTGKPLRVVDVADPTTPYEAAQFRLEGEITDIAIADSYAYVAAGGGGMWVVDLSNPTAPREVGHLNLYAAGLFIAAPYAYVVERDLPTVIANRYYLYSLAVVDITDPTRPRKVGYLKMGYQAPAGWTQRLFVAGPLAYLAAWEEGLRIVDVSNPSRPREVAHHPARAVDIWVSGAYAYVATGEALLILRLQAD